MTGGKRNESYPPSMGDLLPGMGTATGERPPGARLYWGVRAEESRWLRDTSISTQANTDRQLHNGTSLHMIHIAVTTTTIALASTTMVTLE